MHTDFAILHGQTRKHLSDLGDGIFLHQEVLPPFHELKKAAQAAGLSLRLASGFRDFESQLRIWNLKATGQRPLLDAHGTPLDFRSLSEPQIVDAILRWSSLPGASRHHWGTDFDVYDEARRPKDYTVQLIPSEAEEGGPFHLLNEWIEKNAALFGFFRPYRADRGGVSPEWWHLSYAALSQPFLQSLSLDSLRKVIESSELQLKSVVLTKLPEIFTRYIKNITNP